MKTWASALLAFFSISSSLIVWSELIHLNVHFGRFEIIFKSHLNATKLDRLIRIHSWWHTYSYTYGCMFILPDFKLYCHIVTFKFNLPWSTDWNWSIGCVHFRILRSIKLFIIPIPFIIWFYHLIIITFWRQHHQHP